MDLLGTAKSGLHVVADILLADDFLEFGLMNQAGGLLTRAAEDEDPIAGMELAGNLLNGEQPGGIESGHVAQAEDDNRRQRVEIPSDGIDFVGGAEQERSVDAASDSDLWKTDLWKTMIKQNVV